MKHTMHMSAAILLLASLPAHARAEFCPCEKKNCYKLEYTFSHDSVYDKKSWDAICRSIATIGRSFANKQDAQALEQHSSLFKKLYSTWFQSENKKTGTHGTISIGTDDPRVSELNSSDEILENISGIRYSIELYHGPEYDAAVWKELEEQILELISAYKNIEKDENDEGLCTILPINLDSQTHFNDTTGLHLSIECNCENQV